jgi:cold shock CspA family protein
VPQGTVKMFDPETRTGSVLTDGQEEVLVDAETFTASGLMELRLGQRVRFEVDDTGETRMARRLNLVSL